MRMKIPSEGNCDPIAPLELPHSLHAFHRVSSADSSNMVTLFLCRCLSVTVSNNTLFLCGCLRFTVSNNTGIVLYAVLVYISLILV